MPKPIGGEITNTSESDMLANGHKSAKEKYLDEQLGTGKFSRFVDKFLKRGRYYTPISRVVKRKGINMEKLTSLNLDKTELLESIMINDYSGTEDLLLGELQFAYIAFLMAQSLEAFMQWKSLLTLLFGCIEAPFRTRSQLFTKFIKVLIEKSESKYLGKHFENSHVFDIEIPTIEDDENFSVCMSSQPRKSRQLIGEEKSSPWSYKSLPDCAHRVFDEMTMRNEILAFGVVKLLFDPGIASYFTTTMLDNCMVFAAQQLETCDLWNSGANFESKGSFKESAKRMRLMQQNGLWGHVFLFAVTYPNMIEFFENFEVDTKLSDMLLFISLDRRKGCDFAAGFVVGSGSYDATCQFSCSFYWNYTKEAHCSMDCISISRWIVKNITDFETMNGILVNSEPCPKSECPIEKNQGCMHITSTPSCKLKFCWLYYVGNRYEATRQEEEYDDGEKLIEWRIAWVNHQPNGENDEDCHLEDKVN